MIFHFFLVTSCYCISAVRRGEHSKQFLTGIIFTTPSMQIMLSIYLNSNTCKYLSLDNGVTMTSKRRENINLVSFICLSFLVSQEERETILIALGDKFDPYDRVLLDFLSNLKCFTKLTAGNISQVIHELAHQELLQKPRYIIDCFVPILSVLRAFPAFQNFQVLQEM